MFVAKSQSDTLLVEDKDDSPPTLIKADRSGEFHCNCRTISFLCKRARARMCVWGGGGGGGGGRRVYKKPVANGVNYT